MSVLGKRRLDDSPGSFRDSPVHRDRRREIPVISPCILDKTAAIAETLGRNAEQQAGLPRTDSNDSLEGLVAKIADAVVVSDKRPSAPPPSRNKPVNFG